MTPQPDHAEFNVFVERNTAVPERVRLSNFLPDDGVTCTRNGRRVEAGDRINLLNFSMTCRKDPDAAINFAIETAGEGTSNEVFLPARTDRIADLTVRIEELSVMMRRLAPEARVVAFNLYDCPDGWEELPEAHGMFIRGLDKSGNKIDPYGRRELLVPQVDAFAEHAHDIPAKHGDFFKEGDPRVHASNGGGPTNFTLTANPSGDSSKETRPKNIALLYCQKLEPNR